MNYILYLKINSPLGSKSTYNSGSATYSLQPTPQQSPAPWKFELNNIDGNIYFKPTASSPIPRYKISFYNNDNLTKIIGMENIITIRTKGNYKVNKQGFNSALSDKIFNCNGADTDCNCDKNLENLQLLQINFGNNKPDKMKIEIYKGSVIGWKALDSFSSNADNVKLLYSLNFSPIQTSRHCEEERSDNAAIHPFRHCEEPWKGDAAIHPSRHCEESAGRRGNPLIVANLDRHAPTGLAMTRLNRHCEEERSDDNRHCEEERSDDVAIHPSHHCEKPWKGDNRHCEEPWKGDAAIYGSPRFARDDSSERHCEEERRDDNRHCEESAGRRGNPLIAAFLDRHVTNVPRSDDEMATTNLTLRISLYPIGPTYPSAIEPGVVALNAIPDKQIIDKVNAPSGTPTSIESALHNIKICKVNRFIFREDGEYYEFYTNAEENQFKTATGDNNDTKDKLTKALIQGGFTAKYNNTPLTANQVLERYGIEKNFRNISNKRVGIEDKKADYFWKEDKKTLSIDNSFVFRETGGKTSAENKYFLIRTGDYMYNNFDFGNIAQGMGNISQLETKLIGFGVPYTRAATEMTANKVLEFMQTGETDIGWYYDGSASNNKKQIKLRVATLPFYFEDPAKSTANDRFYPFIVDTTADLNAFAAAGLNSDTLNAVTTKLDDANFAYTVVPSGTLTYNTASEVFVTNAVSNAAGASTYIAKTEITDPNDSNRKTNIIKIKRSTDKIFFFKDPDLATANPPKPAFYHFALQALSFGTPTTDPQLVTAFGAAAGVQGNDGSTTLDMMITNLNRSQVFASYTKPTQAADVTANYKTANDVLLTTTANLAGAATYFDNTALSGPSNNQNKKTVLNPTVGSTDAKVGHFIFRVTAGTTAADKKYYKFNIAATDGVTINANTLAAKFLSLSQSKSTLADMSTVLDNNNIAWNNTI